MEEIPLSGGSMTAVVRVGDTVRRAAGPWTPTIHALLRHVRAAGFTAVPEPLGVDEQGREILSFLPGKVGTYPLEPFMWTDAMLVRVAQSLRAFHDATAGFEGRTLAVARARAGRGHLPQRLLPVQPALRRGRADRGDRLRSRLARPAAWDLGQTAYRFVPLTDPDNPDTPVFERHEQARRLALFCEAYDGRGVADTFEAAIGHLRELIEFIVRSAAAGDPAQEAVLARGDVVIYERDLAYLLREARFLA